LGIPADPAFQRRVVQAALALLDRTNSPVLADYPEHVTEAADFTGWACPINLAPAKHDSLVAEVDRLSVWHERARTLSGRTTVGISGLDMPAAGALVERALDGEMPPAQALKEAIDDLKAFYLEAASAFPDAGSSVARKAWFWGETRLGAMLLALQPRLASSDDPQHKILANMTLIPATERHRLG
jgi:hypothetical protein